MWNKADICAVLLSNGTSTAPFPRCSKGGLTSIKAFPSEAAFRWLISLKACAHLAWQLRLRPIRRHFASFAAFSLPSAFLKQFLRIRNAKSFFFLSEHIRLIKYERHFYRLTFLLSRTAKSRVAPGWIEQQRNDFLTLSSGSVGRVVITYIVIESRSFVVPINR